MALDNLLERLNNGEFDNCFSDHTSNGTLTSLYIKNGIPTRRYEGKSTRFFNGKENERIHGKVEITKFTTDEQKKEFIQRYGFIGDLFNYDDDAREESQKYYEERDQ